MRFTNFVLFTVLAVLAGGCVTARYHYSIEVPGADAAAPATVELKWKGGSRTFSVKSNDCITTRITEVMQTPGCVFMDIPRGVDVRVTRDGYKPWEHYYQYVDEDFRTKKWDTFQRSDVVQLESEGSPAASKLIDARPITYR